MTPNRNRHRGRAAQRIAVTLAMTMALGFADATAAGREAGAAASRGTSSLLQANEILNRWEAVAAAAGAHSPAWREMLETQLGLMDASTMNGLAAVTIDAGSAKASYAKFVRAFRTALFQSYTLGLSGKGHMKLGSATTDQMFIPIAPCRIVDTRVSGGQISAGQTRNFYFYSDGLAWDWSQQGGVSGAVDATCPATILAGGAPNEPSAAVVTVTVVSPSAAGNYILWDGADPAPTASALNWSGPGQILANTTIVPAGPRSGSGPGGPLKDFAVKYNGPTGSAHFVADVVGYMIQNNSVALECYEGAMGTASHAGFGAATSVTAPACAAGYALTGGNCDADHHYEQVLLSSYYVGAFPQAAWHCAYRNDGPATRTIYASSICCRVPGR